MASSWDIVDLRPVQQANILTTRPRTWEVVVAIEIKLDYYLMYCID